MDSIDFQHRTRLVFGNGSLRKLGELARELGATRAMVISDSGVVSAGHFDHGVQSLQTAEIEVLSFHEVHENPSTDDVDAGAAIARDFRPDLLVGLGGGSSMDCAKGINFIYSCGGRMEDYWGVGKATGDMLPMIAVPTTAGTGSEAQSFALISRSESHVKMACGDPRAACRIALLDPELTLTQPPRVTSLTGIDAISHAIESYVANRRNELSACYSRQAWRLLCSGFPRVLEQPDDLEARGQVQLGAFFSGLAIETSMLGAAHALANPLTAQFGVTHGQAVGLMLPHVIRFNGQQVNQWYNDLWRDTPAELADATGVDDDPVELLANFVQQIVEQSGLSGQLSDLGVAYEAIPSLAADATKQWTGTFNPRKLDEDDFRELYERAFRCVTAK